MVLRMRLNGPWFPPLAYRHGSEGSKDSVQPAHIVDSIGYNNCTHIPKMNSQYSWHPIQSEVYNIALSRLIKFIATCSTATLYPNTPNPAMMPTALSLK